MELQKILKEQEEEFDKEFVDEKTSDGIALYSWIRTEDMKAFIQSYNQKIIQAVCKKMTGEKRVLAKIIKKAVKDEQERIWEHLTNDCTNRKRKNIVFNKRSKFNLSIKKL